MVQPRRFITPSPAGWTPQGAGNGSISEGSLQGVGVAKLAQRAAVGGRLLHVRKVQIRTLG